MQKQTIFLLLIFLLITGFVAPDKAYALDEINKKLKLNVNHSHLLNFGEQIIRYRVADEKAVKVEVLTDIFNDRHEMIVKPIKVSDSNLLVWTNSRVYNFDISSKTQNNNKIFLNFKNKKENKLKKVLGKYEIDLPPEIKTNVKLKDFEIDLPPEVRKND